MNSLLWTRRYRRVAAPLRSARDARRVVGAGPLVLLVAVVAALFTGCGGGDAEAAHGEVVAPLAAAPSSEVTITATDYDFRASTQRIAAGRVSLTLDNQGDEPHQVQLGRVEPGVTVDSFVQAFHEHGSAAAEKALRWQTGVNGIEPGAKATVIGDLEAGQYLMVCFVPGHDGVSHIDKKMVVPVEVVPGGKPVAAPKTAGEFVLQDYSIDLPKDFPGKGTYAVRNAGPADHELILMRFKDGKGLGDLVAWSDGGSKGESPVFFAGGVSTIPLGETSYVDLDLEPGQYIALCVITGPGGQPHALMGMTAQFEIS
jgi:uncharacterized cupredoxin-like copper-binding protein